MVDGDPGVRGKSLHERDEELNAAVPVSKEQHSQNEVTDPRDRRFGIEQLHKTSSKILRNWFFSIIGNLFWEKKLLLWSLDHKNGTGNK